MKGHDAKAVLLMGGNLGNRMDNLVRARQLIAAKAGLIKLQSSIVESAPWGFESENYFLNQVVQIETPLSPVHLLRTCQEIEDAFNRVRNPEHYISRTMDVDILFFENQVVELPHLTIPHPHLHKRRFTLLPLAEILPRFIHPCSKKTIKELLSECEDISEVHIFEGSK